MPYLRILLIAAIAFGAYILGAHAGRGRYRSIKRNAKKGWNAPSTRWARKTAKHGRRKLTRALNI
ncbi:hypothetical protein ASD65_10970 [Microbacterium sp. Root61]|uniref:hypothetical protein n=1 Tax=Microbacterium sp. Root61 TaxID=1736570 RepID=UPI0006FFBB57|nr:hypothetical protein [Microbacterium sp. Root61]KRA24890.1 hypothetical protein ASD65_10970 [Microbacterium sp. Root61]